MWGKEWGRMTQQISWTLPKHEIIASFNNNSFSIKSNVVKQVILHRGRKSVSSPAVVLVLVIFPRRSLSSFHVIFCSQWSHRTELRGTLDRPWPWPLTDTVWVIWIRRKKNTVTILALINSKVVIMIIVTAGQSHSPSSSGRLDSELQSERMSSSGERENNVFTVNIIKW